MPYPTTTDLSALLVRNGQTAPGTSIMQAALDEAVAEWESMTGYDPFLSTGTPATRYFDGVSDFILRLRSGIVTLTSLRVGVTSTDVGSLLVVNEDFHLYPLDAASKGKPFTYLKFRSRQSREPRSLSISADWGYCTSAAIPADVSATILRQSASKLFSEYLTSFSGGATKIKQRDVEYDFGLSGGTFSATGGQYAKWFMEAAKRYSRIDLL